MTIALYARVSTPHQTQTQTIEQQLERLRARIQEGGAREQPRREECLVFRDDGYSGTTLRRPGLDALRDAVASAGVERVLMTAPDRLARKYVHQVLLLEELERFGCAVEFLDRPMSRDPHDQLLLQIRGAVAEYERTLIAERMRRGRLAKLRTGTLLPWTRVPYGYRVDPDRPRDPSGVRIDPVEGAVVQELFVRYLQPGVTLQGVVTALVREGIPTPHGRRQWSRSTLRWMLNNPVYLGQVYANRTHARPAHQRHSPLQPVGQQGTTLELTARETWLLVTTIPPLVSREVFDQVQGKLAENQRLARRHNTTGDYLLRALVSCGVCGYACKGRQEGRNRRATPTICVRARCRGAQRIQRVAVRPATFRPRRWMTWSGRTCATCSPTPTAWPRRSSGHKPARGCRRICKRDARRSSRAFSTSSGRSSGWAMPTKQEQCRWPSTGGGVSGWTTSAGR